MCACSCYYSSVLLRTTSTSTGIYHHSLVTRLMPATITQSVSMPMRISIPMNLNLTLPLLHHTTQSPFSPRCNSDEGCLRLRKARIHLSIPDRDMLVKPPHPAGDSQTTYIPTALFNLHSENISALVKCEPLRHWYVAQKEVCFPKSLPTERARMIHLRYCFKFYNKWAKW